MISSVCEIVVQPHSPAPRRESQRARQRLKGSSAKRRSFFEATVSQDTFLTACCITRLNLRLRYASSAAGGAKHGNSCPPHNFGSAPNMDKLALLLGMTREQLEQNILHQAENADWQSARRCLSLFSSFEVEK